MYWSSPPAIMTWLLIINSRKIMIVMTLMVIITIINIMLMIMSREGEEVDITCTVHASPPASVTWMKGNAKLSSSGRSIKNTNWITNKNTKSNTIFFNNITNTERHPNISDMNKLGRWIISCWWSWILHSSEALSRLSITSRSNAWGLRSKNTKTNYQGQTICKHSFWRVDYFIGWNSIYKNVHALITLQGGRGRRARVELLMFNEKETGFP